MAQRSPHNPRYQKHTKPKGQTRKSAAAAKPKRAGAAPTTSSKRRAGERPKPGDRSQRRPIPELPPEVKIWRNVWWGLLAGAITVSLVALAVRDIRPWNTVALVVAYILIFSGLAIDFLKVRPARQAQMAALRGKGGKSDEKKSGSSRDAKKASEAKHPGEHETTDETDSGSDS